MKILLFVLILLICFSNNKFLGQEEKEGILDYDYRETVQQIQDLVQNGNLKHTSFERLAYIVDTYGPRLWGSETLEMVIQDLQQQAEDIGFDKVYLDPVTNFTKWVRKEESLTLYSPRPFPQDLKLIGLGESVPGDVKAEVLVVTSFDDLEAKKDQVKGKIVCYSVEWESYDKTVAYRGAGPSKASQYGAVGVLVRSVTPFSIESPHTGATSYDERYPKIPAAAISVEDSNMFLRMRERGQKIVVHLQLDSEFVENQTSYNVIAEITGRQYPDEIILFGGHIDSWDTGSQTGANDDGGGFITCFEALRAIKELGLTPRRTMRFIAWSGEEYGGNESGAAQYVKQRSQKDMENHVLVFESDEGSTTPYGFGFTGNALATAMIKNIAQTNFESIDCQFVNDDGVMVDSGYVADRGVPAMKNLIEDLDETHPYYFTFHHSAGDTMDVMNPDDMDLNVIAIASMMYIVAEIPERLPSN